MLLLEVLAAMMMRYWPSGCSGDDGDGGNDIGSGGRFIAYQPAVMELRSGTSSVNGSLGTKEGMFDDNSTFLMTTSPF